MPYQMINLVYALVSITALILALFAVCLQASMFPRDQTGLLRVQQEELRSLAIDVEGLSADNFWSWLISLVVIVILVFQSPSSNSEINFYQMGFIVAGIFILIRLSYNGSRASFNIYRLALIEVDKNYSTENKEVSPFKDFYDRPIRKNPTFALCFAVACWASVATIAIVRLMMDLWTIFKII